LKTRGAPLGTPSADETQRTLRIHFRSLPMAIAQTHPSSPDQPLVTRSMTPLEWVAIVLMVIGGLNWGLVGLFGVDLVAAIFGNMSVLSRVVYILVALAAIYGIAMAVRFNRRP
jgi:uncharacterized membrane protein YuzA (DUF378 family)